jgi:hypothetical protein
VDYPGKIVAVEYDVANDSPFVNLQKDIGDCSDQLSCGFGVKAFN